MSWTTPRTWVAGEQVTAALMNTHLRDNLNAIAAAGIDGWVDYSGSATWTGATNPTYTVNYARYCQIGKSVVYQGFFTYTSGGTGQWAWSLPVTADSADVNLVVGVGNLFDNSGTDTYLLNWDLASTTTLRGLWDQQSSPGVLTQTAPVTAGASDQYKFIVEYEAA